MFCDYLWCEVLLGAFLTSRTVLVVLQHFLLPNHVDIHQLQVLASVPQASCVYIHFYHQLDIELFLWNLLLLLKLSGLMTWSQFAQSYSLIQH